MGEEGSSMEGGAEHTIVARDVIVRFGNILALDNFSIQVPRGIVGLLGPNGAGKSTFIKTVLGLVSFESGDVRISGMDPRTDVMAIRDRVGYMPEHDCLVDTMTGLELVTYFGRLSGMTKEDSIPRSHEVLDFVGLGEERYRPTSTYSTGMKQRVKLAQAIVHDPEILFLDEPTNGMDPLGREEMLELISRIAASDKSILVSSHILQDMEKVCQHVVIINSGRAISQGPMSVLLDQGRDRKRMQVRGDHQLLLKFAEELRRSYQVISVSEEFGQMTIVLVNSGPSAALLDLAKRNGVQVRSYVPDKLTLEGAFIRSVKEGA